MLFNRQTLHSGRLRGAYAYGAQDQPSPQRPSRESVRSRGDGGDDGTERSRPKPGRTRRWHRRPHRRHPLNERFPAAGRKPEGGIAWPSSSTAPSPSAPSMRSPSRTATPCSGTTGSPASASGSIPRGRRSTSCRPGTRGSRGGSRWGATGSSLPTRRATRRRSSSTASRPARIRTARRRPSQWPSSPRAISSSSSTVRKLNLL